MADMPAQVKPPAGTMLRNAPRLRLSGSLPLVKPDGSPETRPPVAVTPAAPPPADRQLVGEIKAAPTVTTRQTLLDGLYDGVLLTDHQGRVRVANARAALLLEIERKQLTDGRQVFDLIVGFTPAILETVRGHIKNGGFTVMEGFCRRPDNTRVPVEIAVSCLPVTAGNDLCFTLRSTVRRQQAMEMLKTEHAALQSAACGIVITDAEGWIRYANPAFVKLWGRKAGEDRNLIGRHMAEVWPEQTVDEIDRVVEEQGLWSGEVSGVRESGETFVVQATATPNWDDKQKIIGVVFSLIDITRLKDAEKKIRQEAQAQIDRARQTTDFSGLLNILSLPDVMQLVDSSAKTGVLRILDIADIEVAAFGFREGRLVRAVCGEARGEDAVMAALAKPGQSFRFSGGEPGEADPAITASTMNVLLDALRRLDESRA